MTSNKLHSGIKKIQLLTNTKQQNDQKKSNNPPQSNNVDVRTK